jgi:outer membrane protein OmpA-like peptidoglycan-associated protein
MKRFSFAALTIAVVVAAAASVGCATKKYVRETMSPVQQKVEDADKKNTAQDASIEELGRSVSRADERAQGAENKAGDADRDALNAAEQAALANKQAETAQSTAEKGISMAGDADRSVETLGVKVENMDNFKLASTEAVLFGLNKSELDKESQTQLDAFASKVASMKHYVIEVEGFTDSSGAPTVNLELSRRRAAAVVRYLTVDGKIPLYRVNTMGYGKASPVAENKTRSGRKQNRRVEVKLFAPDVAE